MADAYDYLSSLRTVLRSRREDLKEKIARGLSVDDNYQQHVGRAKELADTIEKINAQIKNLHGDTDDDDDTTGTAKAGK